MVVAPLALAIAAAPTVALASGPASGAFSPPGDSTTRATVHHYSGAGDINDHGVVVGYSTAADGAEERPVLWRPHSHRIVPLGSLHGLTAGGAGAVNNKGQIVGGIGSSTGRSHAFLWHPKTRTMTDLGTLGGSAGATDINEKGQVVGWSLSDDGLRRPFLWRPRSKRMVDLGTLGTKPDSQAVAINDHGDVLGLAWNGSHGYLHAWLWKPGHAHLIRLENHGLMERSDPHDINNKGQVVGCTMNIDGDADDAFIWRPGSETTRVVTALGGAACAWGTNDKPQLVGWASLPLYRQRAFMWQPSTTMKNLGTLGGPAVATAVNEKGQIVGYAHRYLRLRAFLWSPRTKDMIDLGVLGGS